MAQQPPQQETLSALRQGAYGGNFESYSTEQIRSIRKDIQSLSKTQRKNTKIRDFSLNDLDRLLRNQLVVRGEEGSSFEKLKLDTLNTAEEAERFGEHIGQSIGEIPQLHAIIGDEGSEQLGELLGEAARNVAVQGNLPALKKKITKIVLKVDEVLNAHLAAKNLAYHSWVRKQKNKLKKDYPATFQYYFGANGQQKVLQNKKLRNEFAKEQKVLTKTFQNITGIVL